MDTLRAFIAVEMPAMVVDMVRECQHDLKQDGIRMKWIPPENVHLTLRFLGNISREIVEDIKGALKELAENSPAFSLQVKGAGVFPKMSQPRVLWLGLAGDTQPLEECHRRLSGMLYQLGFPREKRPFNGHLTVGRMRGRTDTVRLTAVLEKLKTIESRFFSADRICLFKSDLRPDGAVYTPLIRVPTTGQSFDGEAE